MVCLGVLDVLRGQAALARAVPEALPYGASRHVDGEPVTCGCCDRETETGKYVIFVGYVDVWLCSTACARKFVGHLQHDHDMRRHFGPHVTWSVGCR